MKRYILAVDQSTQGTKGMIFDQAGALIGRADRPHRQIISDLGWVSHDPMEILENTLAVCRDVIGKTGIDPNDIAAMGISNQRETTVAWNKETGESICHAIVWQCARASQLCKSRAPLGEMIRRRTGLNLSPYFPAAKMGWILENVPEARALAEQKKLALGTVDSWLIFSLTADHAHKTDYSNASRTQLMDIGRLQWDPEICQAFGVPMNALPEICMSDAVFGMTDLGGFLESPIPICAVLGDSHGALLGQNCRNPGEVKATYGTGSSVMMQTGERMYLSDNGLVTSLAWGLSGKVEYVLEGNLNYTGAVVSWMRDQAGLIETDAQSEALAISANPEDRGCFVPAFTGLGAPYWDSEATGMFTGITRTTGRAELVKAGLESIGYQIADLLRLMEECSAMPVTELRVDGGPTVNRYLMQFQSDITGTPLRVPGMQELSGFGAALAAGLRIGLYRQEDLEKGMAYTYYRPEKEDSWRAGHYGMWQQAVRQVLCR